MDKNKPLIGYDKFLLMAFYKENPLSVMDLNDKIFHFKDLVPAVA